MLDQLQQQLHEIYRTDSIYDVRDFLVTDPHVAGALSGQDAPQSRSESLLLSQDERGLAVTLFLEDELLDRIRNKHPRDVLREFLDDLCQVIEGLSHFNYVAWRAERDHTVSLLELELQAEVDKFASTMQLALEHQDRDMLNGLHARLFDHVRYRPQLSDEQGRRYQEASDYAARFCQGLRQGLVEEADWVAGQLRRFYRMPLTEKISHIHSRAWTRAWA